MSAALAIENRGEQPMAKFCGKCGSPLDQNGRCLQCDTALQYKKKTKNREQNTEKRRRRGFGRLVRTVVLILLIFAVLFGCLLALEYFDVVHIPFASEILECMPFTHEPDLGELNDACIQIDQKKIEMKTETEGTAVLEVTIPDYYQIFKDALDMNDPDRYLQDALKSGTYQTVTRTIDAAVTVEDGNTRVDEASAIDQLLDQELTAAIKAVMEERQ